MTYETGKFIFENGLVKKKKALTISTILFRERVTILWKVFVGFQKGWDCDFGFMVFGFYTSVLGFVFFLGYCNWLVYMGGVSRRLSETIYM